MNSSDQKSDSHIQNEVLQSILERHKRGDSINDVFNLHHKRSHKTSSRVPDTTTIHSLLSNEVTDIQKAITENNLENFVINESKKEKQKLYNVRMQRAKILLSYLSIYIAYASFILFYPSAFVLVLRTQMPAGIILLFYFFLISCFLLIALLAYIQKHNVLGDDIPLERYPIPSFLRSAVQLFIQNENDMMHCLY